MKWRRMAAGANGLWFPFFPLTRWDSYVNTWWDVLGCVFLGDAAEKVSTAGLRFETWRILPNLW
jgi:hypothetical protein